MGASNLTSADKQQPSSPLVTSTLKRTELAATADGMYPFIGERVAVKIGTVVFYDNITKCRWYQRSKVQEKLWLIVYDNKDEEEVNISKLSARQRLYWREQQYDTEGNTKPKAKVSTPSTAKKKISKALTKKQQEGLDKQLPPPKLRSEDKD